MGRILLQEHFLSIWHLIKNQKIFLSIQSIETYRHRYTLMLIVYKLIFTKKQVGRQTEKDVDRQTGKHIDKSETYRDKQSDKDRWKVKENLMWYFFLWKGFFSKIKSAFFKPNCFRVRNSFLFGLLPQGLHWYLRQASEPCRRVVKVSPAPFVESSHVILIRLQY